jgi:hypothetical protein
LDSGLALAKHFDQIVLLTGLLAALAKLVKQLVVIGLKLELGRAATQLVVVTPSTAA